MSIKAELGDSFSYLELNHDSRGSHEGGLPGLCQAFAQDYQRSLLTESFAFAFAFSVQPVFHRNARGASFGETRLLVNAADASA